MLTLALFLGILALPVATVTLGPADRALAQGGASLLMAGLVLWLLLFWTAALALAWPLLSRLLAALPF